MMSVFKIKSALLAGLWQRWDETMPPPMAEPQTMRRMRRVHGEPVFEFGFVSPVRLIGHAGRGYDDIPGRIEIDVLWCDALSPHRTDWRRNMFRPCPRHEVARADGQFEYWSRSIVNLRRAPIQFGRLVIHTFHHARNWR